MADPREQAEGGFVSFVSTPPAHIFVRGSETRKVWLWLNRRGACEVRSIGGERVGAPLPPRPPPRGPRAEGFARHRALHRAPPIFPEADRRHIRRHASRW